MKRRTPSLLAAELLEARDVPALAYALAGTNLVPFDTGNPAGALAPVAITNIAAGETLVGIDFRPQNGFLYGLGVNATADTATLYVISTQTGAAAIVGSPGAVATPGQISFAGTDLPDPATAGYGFDFNPAVDRIRVTTSTGLNFRLNPNTGQEVGAAPDTNITGQSGADASAYTNNVPNTTATTPVTTLYHLNAATDALFIQNPPNTGTAANVTTVTLNGATLDFTAANGFDIPAGVSVATANAAATGRAFAVLTVGTTTQLYSIELSTGVATAVGSIAGASAVTGLAVQNDLGGLPAVGLDATAANLVRFLTNTPGTTSAAVPITGITAGETLVGIDYRPATGQLYALGINAGTDTGTLYLLDPQGGALTVVGAASSVTFAGTDLPPAGTGYGVDFNPTVDRLRVVTGSGLNFRVNPDTGAPVGAAPDAAQTGLPGGSTGASATAYTSSFGGATATTQYTLDAGSDSLFIQGAVTPPGPNGGVQSGQLPLTFNGAPFDFTAVNGFDIPGGVRVSTSGSGAVGTGYALLTVGGNTILYAIDLATGVTTIPGFAGAPLAGASGLAVGQGGSVTGSVVGGGNVLPVSGRPNGTATLFNVAADGTATAGATVTPFPGFTTGNVRSARGDVNGDGVEDTIYVTGPGTPIRFTVISGADNTTVLVPPTAPFAGSEDFAGGGYVSAADFDSDGRAEVVVTPDQGGGPRVTIFSVAAGGALTIRSNFFGIDDPNFRGGARTAVGDVSGDGVPDLIVAAGFLGGPRVAIFNGPSVIGTPARVTNDFFAFPGTDAVNLRNGVFVASGDVDGDGFDDLIFGGGPGGAPRVFILDGGVVAAGNVAGAQAAPIANFFVAGNSTDRGGVRLSTVDADGDLRADVVAGSGENVANAVRVYLGKDFTTSAEPPAQTFNPFGADVLTNGVFVG